MPETLIKVRGVNKTFNLGKVIVHALKDINVEIYRGEYLSIMGPSGSGKSTLFNMIGALDTPSSGSVEVAGINLTQLSARQLAHFRGHHIGYVFQSYNLLYAYDAIGNVSLPLLFGGMDPDKARDRAIEVLKMVGLGHRLTHRPDEMSGGQQQRVAIARSLANNPSVLLCDEPTANLDMHTGQEIIDILVRLNTEKGVTVICATHDHRMMNICDRLMWIRDGQIERIANREDVHIELASIDDDKK